MQKKSECPKTMLRWLPSWLVKAPAIIPHSLFTKLLAKLGFIFTKIV